MRYQDKLDAILTPDERKLFKKLSTPQRVQDYLDSIAVNVLNSNEHTMMSPRFVINKRRAHCAEGAMLAAAALAYHGHPPLLMSLEVTDDDYDHVIAPFKVNGLWGALSKTNYPVLRYRDPVYKTPRELAMSYFHEYFLFDGRKTLRRYSNPFNIQQYDPAKWLTAEGDIDWLIEALGEARHYPIAPRAAIQGLRKASIIEREATKAREWRRNGTRR